MNLNNKEREILRILNENRYKWMYGLEMIRASEGKLRSATIYVYLSRLENKGLIRSRLETDQEHKDRREHRRERKRRLYRITEGSLRQLDEDAASELDPSLAFA